MGADVVVAADFPGASRVTHTMSPLGNTIHELMSVPDPRCLVTERLIGRSPRVLAAAIQLAAVQAPVTPLDGEASASRLIVETTNEIIGFRWEWWGDGSLPVSPVVPATLVPQ